MNEMRGAVDSYAKATQVVVGTREQRLADPARTYEELTDKSRASMDNTSQDSRRWDGIALKG